MHCIVEQQPGSQAVEPASASHQLSVELDSYAIIPSNTPFCDIVHVALSKLGYSATEAIGAKGTWVVELCVAETRESNSCIPLHAELREENQGGCLTSNVRNLLQVFLCFAAAFDKTVLYVS